LIFTFIFAPLNIMNMKRFLLLFTLTINFSFLGLAQIMEVKDINPGVTNSSPSNFFEYRSMLFFRATDPTNGVELWKTDGTDAGTQLVKDIAIGSTNSNPSGFKLFKGKIYFNATTGTAANGSELYVSDGTSAGTTLVKDINPGTANSNPQNLNSIGDSILLFAATDGTTGVELYRTDGSADNIKVVKDYAGTTGSISEIVVMKGIAYTSQIAGAGRELYRSNGTEAGSSLVKDINPGTGNGINTELFVSSKNELYFAGNSGATGTELWKSDGTDAGTVLVKEINVGTGNGNPRRFTEVGGKIYFNAAGAEGVELWETNGTEAGTKLVTDINPGVGNSNPDRLVSALGSLFFFAQADALLYDFYKYDGTKLIKLTDLKVAANTVNSTYAEINGQLYFSISGNLWQTDGTVNGTFLVSSKIPAGPNPSAITNITKVGNQVYFAGQVVNGVELFKYVPLSTSIQEIQTLDIALYPNPTTSHISIDGTISDDASYTIFDISGKVLDQGKIQNKSFQLISSANIQIIKIVDDSKVFQGKVLKL
jgi:ELWxxDGT repeat protein